MPRFGKRKHAYLLREQRNKLRPTVIGRRYYLGERSITWIRHLKVKRVEVRDYALTFEHVIKQLMLTNQKQNNTVKA